jgi:hypothetical protein
MSKKTELVVSSQNGFGIFMPPITAAIKFQCPADLALQHVDQLVVQSDGDTAFLNFYELQPPIILNNSEANQFRADGGRVKATCVARLAMSQSKLKGFLIAMATGCGLEVK